MSRNQLEDQASSTCGYLPNDLYTFVHHSNQGDYEHHKLLLQLQISD